MGIGTKSFVKRQVQWIATVCLILSGVAVGIVARDPLFGASSAEREDHEKAPAKDKKLVTVDPDIAKALGIGIGTAAPATLATEFTVVGSVGFDDTKVARIAVRVSGTVRQIAKSIGDKVAAGDVLAVVDSRDVADAKSAYLAAKNRLANDAIQVVGGKPSVFVPVKSGFRLREVKLGRSDGKSTEIVKGLAAGEKIATGETFALKSELENAGDAEMGDQRLPA